MKKVELCKNSSTFLLFKRLFIVKHLEQNDEFF